MKGTGDTKPIMGHWDERIYLATANGELWEGRWGSDEPDPESPNWKPNAPLSFHKTELVIKVIDLVNPAIQSPPAPVARNYRTPQAQALASALQQGMLEASNVNSVIEITRLIEIQRAYEGVARMMDNTAELSRSAVERLIASQKLPDGLRYAAFIPTYAGGCSNIFRLVVRPGVFSKAPMLFIHGTADDYTPIHPCQDYADRIRAAGTPVEFVAIEGAHHKFDSDDTRRHFLARASKTSADCPIEVDIDNFQAFDRQTGARLQGEAYNTALKNCRAMGANVEGNKKARDQAAEAALSFLKKTFAM